VLLGIDNPNVVESDVAHRSLHLGQFSAGSASPRAMRMWATAASRGAQSRRWVAPAGDAAMTAWLKFTSS